jgi:hypothetical protein
MNRRTASLVALVAAAVAFAAVPALAQEANTPDRPARSQGLYPPAWVDETVDEIRSRIAERIAAVEDRITESDRLTGEQKTQALENLRNASNAIDAAGEPAEIVGTATSRAQLQRIAWRAERRGDIPDYEKHIDGDIARDTRRYDHLVTITGWADAAGVDVSAVNGYLDEAAGQLRIAEGSGTVEQRHDAAHIARAWMVQAHTTLMPG